MSHAGRVAAAIAVFVAASLAAGQSVPADLSALAARAGLGSPIAAWCRGEFRAGHPRAFALALASPAGGRYVVLESDATVIELAPFTRDATLSCYSRADARKLDGTIRRSETIHGAIAPRWRTTIVCAFVDPTTSVCWQYSPIDRAFVKVGGWTT